MSIALANKSNREDADAAVEALKEQFPDQEFAVNEDGNPPRYRIVLESELGVAKEGEEAKVTDTPTVDSMRRVASSTLRKERIEAAQRRAKPRVGSMARGGQGGAGPAVGAGTGRANTDE